MIRASIDSSALDALIGRLEQAPAQFVAAAEVALDEEVDVTLDALRAESPVRTGFFRAHWARRNAGRLRRQIVDTAAYAKWVHRRGEARFVDTAVPRHLDSLTGRLRARLAVIARAALLAGPRLARGARPRLGR